MTSPTELYQQARAALAEQRTDAADLLLRRALDLCGPSDAETRLRVRLSSTWVTYERSGPEAALAEVRAVAADAALLPHVAAAAGVSVPQVALVTPEFFVLEYCGTVIATLLEKWPPETFRTELTALACASEDLGCDNLLLITLADEGRHDAGNGRQVDVVPIARWLLDNK